MQVFDTAIEYWQIMTNKQSVSESGMLTSWMGPCRQSIRRGCALGCLSKHQTYLDLVPSPGAEMRWGCLQEVSARDVGSWEPSVGAGKKGVSVTRRGNRTFMTPHSNYTLEWLDCGGNWRPEREPSCLLLPPHQRCRDWAWPFAPLAPSLPPSFTPSLNPQRKCRFVSW